MRIHCVVVLALAFIASPVIAQSNDIGIWYSTASIKDTGDSSGRLTFGTAKGHGVSFNHYWTQSISTELAGHWLRAQGGIDVNGTRILDVGKLEIKPITANLQWHFARASMVSPYVGAGVAYVSGGHLSNADLDAAGAGTVTIAKKTTWDANAGINIGLGRMFAVGVDGMYIKYEPGATSAASTQKLKLNPLVLSLGLRLRW